jgi:hypothetical protein
MKKLIAFVLVVALMASLAGCCCCLNLQECDTCGELGFHQNTVRINGREYPVCDDCYDRYFNYRSEIWG